MSTEEAKDIAMRTIGRVLDKKPQSKHLWAIGVLSVIADQMEDHNQDNQARRVREIIDHIEKSGEEEVALREQLSEAEAQADLVQERFHQMRDEIRTTEECKALESSNETLRWQLDMARAAAQAQLADRDETIAALERLVEQQEAGLAKFNALDLPEPCDCACGCDDCPLPEEAITPEEEARIERCYTREEVRQAALRTFCFAKDSNARGTPYEAIDRYISALDN